jgi:release factor glutamine methyltransferase
MPTIRQAVTWANGILSGHAIESARRDAEILILHVMGLEPVKLYTHGEQELTTDQHARYEALIARRAKGEPVAYLVGKKEFYALDFAVGPAVLIPRPETEILVEKASVWAPAGAHVLEIGVGSGAVIVALAVQRPDLTLYGLDISLEALRTARDNARRHGVAERVRLFVGDALLSVGARFPLILMNPPYIAQAEAQSLSADVACYEPAIALFGGNDGLDVIRKVLSTVTDNLTPGGRLLMECGYDQQSSVTLLVGAARGLMIREWTSDLGGIPRVVIVEKTDG